MRPRDLCHLKPSAPALRVALGGFFLWARLPDSCPLGATALAARCAAHAEASGNRAGVMFLAGPRCRLASVADDSSFGAAVGGAQAARSASADAAALAANDENGPLLGNASAAQAALEESEGDVAALDRWARLCFAWLGDDQLRQGVARLADACATAAAAAAADTPRTAASPSVK